MTNTLLTLHDPALAKRHYAQGLWRSDTFFSLLEGHATRRPKAPALRDGNRTLAWRELLGMVEAVAGDLLAAGLKRGERVAVWLPERVEAVAVFLACSRQGFVCCPSLHRNYRVAEILGLLSRTRAAALFALPGYGADGAAADIFAAARDLPFLRRLYTLGEGAPEAAPFPNRTRALPPADTDPDKILYLAFTSGTTGTPKGVMHSDNTLLANGRAMVADWNHDENTILLSLSPLSHHIATVAIEQMLVAGCQLVVNTPPCGMTPLDWILETGASYVMGVPTHAIDILAELRRRKLKRLGRVKVFYMAGSPIPREVAAAFLALGVLPQNVYGMTENGSHQYTLPSDREETIVGTCGRACNAYEIAIFDKDDPDRRAAPGESGEIGGKGASLTLGYFDDQRASEESFNRDGWFMSGDLGRLDANGCLEILGRKKDLIIRGGRNIHPAAIENLAMRHKSVAKAAAFPVADPRLGERVCLAVVFAEGETSEAEAILSHLYEEGLSPYDMPEYFLALPEFPLSASGKILKRALVDWAREGRVQPFPVRFTDPSRKKGSRNGDQV